MKHSSSRALFFLALFAALPISTTSQNNSPSTISPDLLGEDPDKIKWERQQAESAGMRFVSIPVSGWAPPTNEQVAQFLSLFQNHKEKIFVHCRFGDDRTGVFVAAYRMAHDRWPPHQAIKEMYFFGFNGFWHPAMKSYINDFPSKLKTAPALAPFEKSM